MEFTVSSRSAPTATLITIGGDVDVFGAAEVGYRIDAALRLGCRGFWLDAGDVSFLDLAACSQLAHSAAVARAFTATLGLVAASDRFLRGCEIARLRVFDVRRHEAGRPALAPCSQLPREPRTACEPPGPDQHALRPRGAAHPEG